MLENMLGTFQFPINNHKYDITVMSRQIDTKQYTEQIIEFKNITQYIEQFSRLGNWIHADKNKQTISEQNKIAGVVYGEQLKIMKTFVQQFKSYLRDNDPNHVPSDDVDKLLVQACLSSFQFLDHMTSLLKLDMKLGRFDYAQGRQSSLSNLETQFELTIQIMALLYERSRNQPKLTLILSHYYLNFAVKAFKMIETIVAKTSGESTLSADENRD